MGWMCLVNNSHNGQTVLNRDATRAAAEQGTVHTTARSEGSASGSRLHVKRVSPFSKLVLCEEFNP